jgi:signal transduction histidine kinase
VVERRATDPSELEQQRIADQLIAAEQEERRRIALFLHDGPVQSLAGVSLMLDAAIGQLERDEHSEALSILGKALARTRETIQALRDLSFNLEPVALRDQGFEPAIRALAEQLALSDEVAIRLEVAAAEKLTENAQVALYQIIREALHHAIRRGPPRNVTVSVEIRSDARVEAQIRDDAPGERRRASYDAIAQRARSLHGKVSVEAAEPRGTIVRVVLPPYAATQ